MKIGFIGTGNMASAIIKGLISSKCVEANNIMVFDVATDKLQQFTAETGTNPCTSNDELVRLVDVVVLATKPNIFSKMLPPLKAALAEKKPLLVSIAAGMPIANIQALIGEDLQIPIVRVMPNVNCLIGEGTSAVCGNAVATEEQVQFVLNMFNSIGIAVRLEESYFSIFIGIAGSAPAYAYLFIDSLARGALKAGMPKAQATQIAAHTVLGSAKMILEGEDSPWELIDKVCSPGGTTIAGICALEDEAFISTVVKCVEATINKDKELMK